MVGFAGRPAGAKEPEGPASAASALPARRGLSRQEAAGAAALPVRGGSLTLEAAGAAALVVCGGLVWLEAAGAAALLARGGLVRLEDAGAAAFNPASRTDGTTGGAFGTWVAGVTREEDVEEEVPELGWDDGPTAA